jgi:hypothetical protein
MKIYCDEIKSKKSVMGKFCRLLVEKQTGDVSS